MVNTCILKKMPEYKQEIIKIKVVLINTDNGEWSYNYFMKNILSLTPIIAHTDLRRLTQDRSHPSHLRIGPAPVLSVYHSCTIIMITTMLLEIYDTLKKFF